MRETARQAANLRPDDDDLWQLDGVRADRVEDVLKLVDHRNEALHLRSRGSKL